MGQQGQRLQHVIPIDDIRPVGDDVGDYDVVGDLLALR
jgi:hypothetical protein